MIIKHLIKGVLILTLTSLSSNLYAQSSVQCPSKVVYTKIACADFTKAHKYLTKQVPSPSLISEAASLKAKYCSPPKPPVHSFDCEQVSTHLCEDYTNAKVVLQQFTHVCPACAAHLPYVSDKSFYFCNNECDTEAGRANLASNPPQCPTESELNAALTSLKQHAIETEGLVPRFYVDKKGLVTIGIGQLLDNGSLLKKIKKLEQQNKPPSEIEAVKEAYENATNKKAKKFIKKYLSGFKKSKKQASFNDVFTEWKRLRDNGKPGDKGVIKFTQSEKVYEDTIKGYLKTMHNKKPSSQCMNGYTQAALIDVRFNPAKVKLFGDKRLNEMWEKLDASSENYDPCGALDIFEDIDQWKKQGFSYQKRHQRRVDMFLKGISGQ